MVLSPVTRVTTTGLAGGWSCLTESAVWAKRSGIVRPAVVSAPSERKSRRVVMQGMVTKEQQVAAGRNGAWREIFGQAAEGRGADSVRARRPGHEVPANGGAERHLRRLVRGPHIPVARGQLPERIVRRCQPLRHA